MITCREFQTLAQPEAVHLYRISNRKGEYVELLDRGASIHAICVADRDGRIGDIVLGAPEGVDLDQCNVIGSTIGRCANRIAHGRYEADGKVFQLEQNARGHFLHGASGNYAKRMFSAAVDEAGSTVTFTLQDNGEGGWDCAVLAQVSYSFDDDSVLTMTIRMVPEDTTVLNPTNHAYFNMGVSDVRTLQLTIQAHDRAGRDGDGLPDGSRIPAAGTPADFTRRRSIADAMAQNPTGYFTDPTPRYDEFYPLDRPSEQPAAELYSPDNGRVMRIVTDMPSIVLFVPDKGKPVAGKDGRTYTGYCAVCLEPGFVPNAVNCPQFDSPLFRKGEELYTVTKYIFSTDQTATL